MNIDYLRAKALAYAPTFRLPLCLDDAKRADVDSAAAFLGKSRAELERLESLPSDAKRSKSLAAKSPTKEAEEKVAKAEAGLQAAEDAASDDVLILTWRRLDPDAYDALVKQFTPDGRLDMLGLYPALAEACWYRAESSDGEDVGLSWPEALAMLNNADREVVYVGVLNLNRAPSSIPFSPRSSGAPATSSEPA